jgi:hypothetical protein
MAGPYTAGNLELLTTNFNRDTKNIALARMIMRNAVTVQKSVSGTERFYKESIKELDVDSDIPRDATFTSDRVTFDTLDITPQKHGCESRVAWEDAQQVGNDIVARTTLRLANRVARSVNTKIWNVMTENVTPVNINTAAAVGTWNNATRATRLPHEDIAKGIGFVSGTDAAKTNSFLQAYEATDLFLSPFDYIYVRSNDYIMSSFDSAGAELMRTGNMGNLFGLTVNVSPVVTAAKAAVADAKSAVIWAENADLNSSVDYTAGKYYTFSAWAYGNAALVNPRAVHLITGTQT